jgi:hypothetical protein
MKNVALFFIALCLSVNSWAYDFEVDGVYYDITSGIDPLTVAVTGESDNHNSPSSVDTIQDGVV